MAGLLWHDPRGIVPIKIAQFRARAKYKSVGGGAMTTNRPASSRTDTAAMKCRKVGKQSTHVTNSQTVHGTQGPASIVDLKSGKIKHSGNLFGQREAASLGKAWVG